MQEDRNRPLRELQKGYADARLHEKCHALCFSTQQDALGWTAARQRHRLPAGNGVRRVSEYEETAFEYGAGDAEENPDVRVDLDYSGDLVRGAVRLGRAVEQMTDDAPQHDTATMPLQIDSKRRKKLKQKKTSLGHAEDDHEDWNMEQHL